MHPDFNAFSVLTKGYACGLGAGGYEAFAILSKGYVCIGVVAAVGGGDSVAHRGRRRFPEDTSMDALLIREDDEVLAVVMAISRRKVQ